nr:hypothetical protein GCM10020063_019830 [Dactylosporangium thailandense]
MPIEVARGEPFPVAAEADVAALVEWLGPAAANERRRGALGDHFAYEPDDDGGGTAAVVLRPYDANRLTASTATSFT